MKITAQEEYGIRILLRIANSRKPEGITIPQLSETEGLSQHYTAKLCRILRMAGFIKSTRGKDGGYFLAHPAEQININKVLTSLGGRLYSEEFCKSHTGQLKSCCHTCACSVRSLWQVVQDAVDNILDHYSLQDLINTKNGSPSVSFPEVLQIMNIDRFQKSNSK
jgi:Rrf2 family protein